MFVGQYNYSLDSKGRVVIPLDYRKQMGTTVMVSMGYDNYITVYTKEGYADFKKKTIDPLDDLIPEEQELKMVSPKSSFLICVELKDHNYPE